MIGRKCPLACLQFGNSSSSAPQSPSARPSREAVKQRVLQKTASPFLFRTYDRLVNSVEISHLFIALVGSQPRLGPAGCGLPICSCSGVCCTLYLKPSQPRGVRSLPRRRHAGPADLRR